MTKGAGKKRLVGDKVLKSTAGTCRAFYLSKHSEKKNQAIHIFISQPIDAATTAGAHVRCVRSSWWPRPRIKF